MEVEIGIISTLIGWFITILVSIKSFIANSKLKKKDKLVVMIDEWCIKAESFKNYSGMEKLEKVLNYALEYCVTNKIKFDKNLVINNVEKVIKSSKFINARDELKVNVSHETINKEEVIDEREQDITVADSGKSTRKDIIT